MAIVRLEALTSLVSAITCAIPELKGRVCIGQADPSKELSLPSLSVNRAGRWLYHPDQALETFDPAPDRVVMNVGRHEGTLQLRLKSSTSYERYRIEQLLVDLFLETPLHPGVLLTEVLGCCALGDWLASWVLEDDEWDDAPAFDQQFDSLIHVTGTIPALVTRLGAWTIEQLQLGITHDFDTTFTPATFSSSPLVEVVQINQDGTITKI